MRKLDINNRRYLGSKAKLLSFISEVVNKECGNINIFLDLFGGTGNVAWNFNNQYTTIMVNDILMSNYLSYIAWFGSQEIDEGKISDLIVKYNELEILDSYSEVLEREKRSIDKKIEENSNQLMEAA